MKFYLLALKQFCLFIFIYLTVFNLTAQQNPELTHYSVDDGLSENHVLCMYHDNKGFLWMGTHSGLERFDGYSFTNFKGDKDDKFQMLDYRLDGIKEDQRGSLWVRTHNMNVYRFNPENEAFVPFPQSIEEFKNFDGSINRITILNDGTIWLNRIEAGNDVCFKLEYLDASSKMNITRFSYKTGDILSDQIHLLYSDVDKNTWILSTGGINLLKKNEVQTEDFTNSALSINYYSICETDNFVFFGGGGGNFIQYNKKEKVKLKHKLPNQSDIVEVYPINEKEVFVGTNSTRSYTFNIQTQKFTPVDLDNDKCTKVYGYNQDGDNKIWIDSDFNGAVYFNGSTAQIEYLSVSGKWYSNSVRQYFYTVNDSSNNTWVQIRDGGIYRYNKKENALEPIVDRNSQNISNVTHSGLTDHQGNLWLSSYMQGLYKVVYNAPKFEFLKPNKKTDNALNNEVRAVFKDADSSLWIGAKDGLTYLFDQNKQWLGFLCEDGSIGFENPLKAPVYNIIEDHTGVIWLATKGNGVFTLKKQTKDKYEITNFKKDPNNPFSISSNAVYHIYEDKQHRLWLATFNGGLNIVDTINQKISFIHSGNLLENYPIKECCNARYVTSDVQCKFYIGTTNGLLICTPSNRDYASYTFNRFTHDRTQDSTLSGNDIQYILPSKNNDLYLALSGGSLNRVKGGYKVGEHPKFKKIKNFPPDIIYTLLEDSANNIWMSAQTRIIKFNAKTEEVEIFKPKSLNPYFFSEAAVYRSGSNGEIMYGTSNGMLAFNSQKIKKSAYKPRIYLDQLQLNNQTISVAKHPGILPKSLDNLEELVITHKQNNVSISYAAIDYANPESVQYAFYLEGLEEEWNYVGHQRVARYNNIPKGEFVLHVKSTNSDEVWVENEKTIRIIRRPSFWESNWGVVFYVLLILLISGIATYIVFIIYRLRNEVEIEHRISEMKLRFFTDISHELRTPLTLIISPVDNLINKMALPKSAKDQLVVVQRNTHRLLKLINQILDFRKIQNKKMKLFVEAVVIANYLDDICSGFKKLAEEKNIQFKIIDHSEKAQLWIDKDKFEKIFYNLLSNAFKFSRSNSQIRVQIEAETEHIKITVQDQGVGISKDKLKLLFNRFESFAPTKSALQGSTGIGLSLIKELVDLHHGKIEVESESGKGSLFIVRFKKGHAHFGKEDEFLLHDLEKDETPKAIDERLIEPENVEPDVLINEDSADALKRHTLVIAEDNEELNTFLCNSLRDTYNIHSAINGQAAIELAQEHNPDLIISDIMMPGIDGLELTEKLKGDVNTSHIPIILLTAKSNMESKLIAMKHGVDDYITKPFSLAYLEARVENLLKIRLQLQEYYKSSLTSGIITLSKPEVSNLDQEFLQQIVHFLEENYDNSEIVVEDIREIVGVSRSSFFKKLKSLTGLSPVEFMREFRLQKSTQIIESGETNVSQLAYRVGINDARYFSKCFKQKFGISPKEFMTKKNSE